MNQPNRNMLILVFVGIAMVLGLLFFLGLNAQPKAVKDAPHKTTFVNTTTITEKGGTSYQVEALNSAFQKYINGTGKKVNSVTLGEIAIKPRNPESDANDKISFTVYFDTDPHKAEVEYLNLDEIRLRLFSNKGNKLEFDSGAVKAQVDKDH